MVAGPRFEPATESRNGYLPRADLWITASRVILPRLLAALAQHHGVVVAPPWDDAGGFWIPAVWSADCREDPGRFPYSHAIPTSIPSELSDTEGCERALASAGVGVEPVR